jgi:hypothetical protein
MYWPRATERTIFKITLNQITFSLQAPEQQHFPVSGSASLPYEYQSSSSAASSRPRLRMIQDQSSNASTPAYPWCSAYEPNVT